MQVSRLHRVHKQRIPVWQSVENEEQKAGTNFVFQRQNRLFLKLFFRFASWPVFISIFSLLQRCMSVISTTSCKQLMLLHVIFPFSIRILAFSPSMSRLHVGFAYSAHKFITNQLLVGYGCTENVDTSPFHSVYCRIPHNHQHSIQLCKFDHVKCEFSTLMRYKNQNDLYGPFKHLFTSKCFAFDHGTRNANVKKQHHHHRWKSRRKKKNMPHKNSLGYG